MNGSREAIDKTATVNSMLCRTTALGVLNTWPSTKISRTALQRRGSARTGALSGDPTFGHEWQEHAYAVPPTVKALPLLREECAL